jgi:hypothetical protein
MLAMSMQDWIEDADMQMRRMTPRADREPQRSNTQFRMNAKMKVSRKANWAICSAIAVDLGLDIHTAELQLIELRGANGFCTGCTDQCCTKAF